jgi:hypothetical protein
VLTGSASTLLSAEILKLIADFSEKPLQITIDISDACKETRKIFDGTSRLVQVTDESKITRLYLVIPLQKKEKENNE